MCLIFSPVQVEVSLWWLMSLNVGHNCCRGAKGAKASFAVNNETLAEVDSDWIIICPCGLDLEETAHELKAIRGQPWW